MATNEPTPNDIITLKVIIKSTTEWFNFLLSKWKIIVIAGIIGAILGIGYSFKKKPVYTAALTFAIEDDKSGGAGGVLNLASQFGISLGSSGGSIFEGGNLIELFRSRTMVEQALMKPVFYKGDTISLAEMYIQNMKWREKWNKKPKLAEIQFIPGTKRKSFTRVHDSILGLIYTDLSKNSLYVGQKDKKISIITMEVSSTNELFSKFFCEELAQEVGLFYVTTKSKKARDNMEVLARQTDSIRRELNGSLSGLASANDNTFNLNPALNIRRVPSAQKQVDVQANTAILTELVKQTELAKVTLRRDTPLIQVLDKPILPLKTERFGKLKGLVLGGFLAGFLASFVLIIKKYYL
ncbi:MAG: lipopolysaccharide biosynthesis protein [Flavobacterium sp.]|nr:lipopolysaccharide biosynthesis protein [Flavobacterium sp.]